MPLSTLLRAVTAVTIGLAVATGSYVGGLSVEGFLTIIVAMNGIELGMIVYNTAGVSELKGVISAYR